MAAKRTENHAKDPYQLIDSPHFPGYAERLKRLGAFDNLDNQDARHVAALIITDQTRIGPHKWADGIRGPRDVRPALQQRAANIGTGCDVRKWIDNAAASKALGIAADALAAHLTAHRDETGSAAGKPKQHRPKPPPKPPTDWPKEGPSPSKPEGQRRASKQVPAIKIACLHAQAAWRWMCCWRMPTPRELPAETGSCGEQNGRSAPYTLSNHKMSVGHAFRADGSF